MPSEDGEPGSNDNPIRFRDQVYRTLLDECLESGSLFSDPTFGADQTSIGLPEDPDPKNVIKWLRPKVTPRVPLGPPAASPRTPGTSDGCFIDGPGTACNAILYGNVAG